MSGRPASPLTLLARAASLNDLTPALRMLLITDGTVTQLLEALFLEPVAVTQGHQRMAPLGADADLLGCEAQVIALDRKVNLEGVNTGRVLVTAQSRILLETLPAGVARALERGEVGIGELLRDRQLESFREIINYGLEPHCVWRRYRICTGGRPAIVICERFQREHFETPNAINSRLSEC